MGGVAKLSRQGIGSLFTQETGAFRAETGGRNKATFTNFLGFTAAYQRHWRRSARKAVSGYAFVLVARFI